MFAKKLAADLGLLLFGLLSGRLLELVLAWEKLGSWAKNSWTIYASRYLNLALSMGLLGWALGLTLLEFLTAFGIVGGIYALALATIYRGSSGGQGDIFMSLHMFSLLALAVWKTKLSS